MKKTKEGIPVVNREELNLILDRIEEKYQNQFKGIVDVSDLDAFSLDADTPAKYTQEEVNAIHKKNEEIKSNVKPKKGILLMGKPGVGKTTIMNKRYGKSISSNQIATHYMLKGIEGFVNQQANLMYPTDSIDDLGTEIVPSHYGNKLDLIPYLLQLSYEQNRKFGFYTTNLSYEELKERYGSRVVDRLQEKCYFFILEDEPFRKLATAETINKDLQ